MKKIFDSLMITLLLMLLGSCSNSPHMGASKYKQGKYHGGMAKRSNCEHWNPTEFKK